MARPSAPSAVSALALQQHGGAAPSRLAADVVGDSGSRSALQKLNAAIGELKALAVQPLLQSAVNALHTVSAPAITQLRRVLSASIASGTPRIE